MQNSVVKVELFNAGKFSGRISIKIIPRRSGILVMNTNPEQERKMRSLARESQSEFVPLRSFIRQNVKVAALRGKSLLLVNVAAGTYVAETP